ncbi:MAG: hypothetical protein L0Y71_13490 [Gemmataceae bacterium]|nr:hypothetical protein [Gemmataceae bacterium]
MSVITFQCYACNQVLQVGADKAGRRAKCSQCGTVLTIPMLAAGVVEGVLPAAAVPAAPQPPPVPAAAPTAAPGAAAPTAPAPSGPVPSVPAQYTDAEPLPRRRTDDDDRPRRGRDDDYAVRRRPASKWDKVKIGFLLVFIGVSVMAGAYAVELIGRLVSMIVYASGAFGASGVAFVFLRIGLIVAFVATIATIVGHVFWLFVSNRTGALGFGIAALAVCGVYLVFQIVGRMIPAFQPGLFRSHPLLTMFANMLAAAHFMMMGFYVRAVGMRLDEPYAERRGMLLVILSGALGGYELLSGIILTAASGIGGAVLYWLLFWLGAIFTVVVYVFALLTIFEGKRIVDREAGDTAH